MKQQPYAIVESLHSRAIREINKLDIRIMQSEDDADAALWKQAELVAARLDAGMTQRELAAEWINARTGEPYSVMHVNYTKQAFVKFTLQNPRPKFRDAYNEIANASKRKARAVRNHNSEPEPETETRIEPRLLEDSFLAGAYNARLLATYDKGPITDDVIRYAADTARAWTDLTEQLRQRQLEVAK